MIVIIERYSYFNVFEREIMSGVYCNKPRAKEEKTA